MAENSAEGTQRSRRFLSEKLINACDSASVTRPNQCSIILQNESIEVGGFSTRGREEAVIPRAFCRAHTFHSPQRS